MLALVMVAALLPTAAFAQTGGVTEPVADESTTDGSPSSDETQPPEGQIEEGDTASDSPSEAPGLPDGQDEQEEEPAPEDEPEDEPVPEEDVPDGSDMGIATIALSDEDAEVLQNFCQQYPGEYKLPDGSDWMITVSEDGLKLSGDGTENATIDSITTSVKTVVFASDDWWNSSKSKTQTLTLTWTTAVSSTYAHKSFKCTATTLYDSTKKAIKGFTANSYFIAEDGIFSYEYFKEYAGTYALSTEYGNTYGGDIEGIGEWYIEIDENGHVYLHEGDEKYEAVMTAGATTNNISRVKEMYVAVPGWYTNTSWTTPVYVKLTWGYDEDSKSAGYGKGALYFTTTKQDKIYKQNNKTVVYLPALRFERRDLTDFAKSQLAPFAGDYLVSDGTDEKIVIATDGSVELHMGEGKVLTPLYYVVDNTNWREETDKESAVTSVVFSDKDWFSEANKKAPSVPRATVTMTWDPANLQFAVSSDVPCYKEGITEVIRNFTTSIKYTRQETLDEGAAYFSQFVKGTYTLNDGSGWKIKVELDETDNKWKIYTDFGAGEFTPVANPSPVFAQDAKHIDPESSSSDKGEWGIGGKYLASVTVPVTGWFSDPSCTQPAVVTLYWNGNVTNPMDDHQFTAYTISGSNKKQVATPIYRPIEGGTECKYLTGTFYSDTDREKGQEYLAENYAGIYRPTAAKDKWYIEITTEGTVTVHAFDANNVDHPITNVAMDITIDKKITNKAEPDFGKITGVTDIKVVVPEWRTVQTNDTLANITQCEEITFTLTPVAGGSSYFTPSQTYIYDDADENGTPWGVVAKSSQLNYNKTLSTKIYNNDRAYTEDNKDAAKEYFKQYPGTYYIDDPDLDYMITITDEGEIYWGDYASGEAGLPADVAFDAIKDENGNNKVDEDETTPVPGTISVWLNGYTTAKVSTSNTKPYYTDGTQRANLTWNDTDEKDIVHSAHKFKTSGKSAAKGYKGGVNPQITFALNTYYARGDQYDGFFMEDGTYETTDGEHKIVIETKDGKPTYTFYRPDWQGIGYPLTAFQLGDTLFLRGKIGMMRKLDVYLVVTKGPYEGFDFLLTKYEVTYNDLNGKQQTSSSAPTVTLPAMTRFTNYDKQDAGAEKNIIVAGPGEDVNTGTPYSRLSLALHNVQDGSTIYLKDDIRIGFEAMLPDGVGTVTIDGQGHKILRDTYVDPGSALAISTDPILMDILSDPRIDPEIVLTALEDYGLMTVADVPEEEHYTGAILRVGEGDTVTLKNVTIDGEGNWEIDQEKLEYEKELNQSYDIDVLVDPQGGHPIKELEGNVVSTESLIKVAGGTLKLDGVTLENFFAGDGYDDDRHFIDFMSKEDGKLEVTGKGAVFQHNASRSGVCIGNTDDDVIDLSGCTTMEGNYCYGGNGGLVVAMEGTQVYMSEGTKIVNNVAADTNGTFIQLHKKTDGVKDGDNKGETYSKLHMNGGEISHNVGLRGGEYGWGNTVYLYNGGAFEMNGGEIHDNMGAGISSIYQQPSADALQLNAGKIYNNTCSLTDEGTDWALDIALMNKGTIGEDMVVEQNYVVGAAAILGGYASGDEYLTNNGEIHGNISVYSYFNNEGNTSTVVNNNLIEGDIRLENGSLVKNGESGTIRGNITVRGALTESAGVSSFHNEGKIEGNVELAEGAHLYNSGDITGDVTVKSGGTLEMNCNDGHMEHTGTIFGNVTVYPDGLLYASVTPTRIEGTITLEYEDEEDLERMLEVLKDCEIQYDKLVTKEHKHEEYEEVIEPNDQYKCTDPWVYNYVCKTCGKVVETKETEPTGRKYIVTETTEATCTTGEIETVRCENCTAYNSTNGLKLQKSAPLGHDYVELTQLYIPPTEYGSGHIYYKCTVCGDLLEFEIDEVHSGNTKHSFQDEDGALIEKEGEVTKDPTCTEDGEMTFECDECHTKITVTIPATGHQYPLAADAFSEDCEVLEDAPSTCTTAGHITYVAKCTVCGDTSASNKYQVNLKKLEHQWTDWADVDDTIDYPCTMEREQERHCETCDLTETRLESEIKHEWDPTGTICLKCGMVKDGQKVVYNRNGGGATTDFIAKTKMTYAPDTTVTLWQPSDEKAADKNAGIVEGEDSKYYWIKTTAMGSAVFVGWSTVDCGAEPYHEEPTDAQFVTEVTIGAADVPVYAVWALDRNGNKIADYDETDKVTLEYDANGGSGDTPADMTELLVGASYPLVTECDLKSGTNVFAGWSTAKTDVVIPKDITGIDSTAKNATGDPVSKVTWKDASGADKSVELLTSPYTIPKPTSGNTVTLYAVYAEADAEGKPAFDDNYYHVEYYAPGATGNRDYTVAVDGLFYTCNDHHVAGEEAALMTTKDASVMVYKKGAVLIGFTDQEEWNAANHEFITKEADESVLITKVTIPEGENAKVYAVWAIDENNNGIRDYHESRYTHRYDLNDRLRDHSMGDTPTLPFMDGGKPTSASTLTITNSAKLPADIENVLVGQYVPFPGADILFADSNVIEEADLYSADGKTVLHHYIQIGWSGYPHNVAESEQDARNWVIGYGLSLDSGIMEDNNGYLDEDGIFHREIKDPRFINAYVVWALDDDRDGKPDYLKETSDSGGSGATVCDGGVNCPSRDYTDVDRSTWYHEYVDYVIANKLMLGRAEHIFDPDGITTRAEVVTILYRLEGEPAVTRGAGFDDVLAGQWYYDAISWAAANEVVLGYGNGKFGPDDTVTREQMAAILYRYVSFKGYDVTRLANLTGYTDAGKVSGWAAAAMQWAVGEGIIQGTCPATLCPYGDSTRAQVAAMFMRFCRKIEK